MTMAALDLTKLSASHDPGTIGVSTKFMESYEIARSVSGGGSLALFLNDAGHLDIYSTGIANEVYRIRPQTDADSSWVQADLNITATQISVHPPGFDDKDRDNPDIFGLNANNQLTRSTWNGSAYQQVVSQPTQATQKIKQFLSTKSFGTVYANVILDDDTVAASFLKPNGQWATLNWTPVNAPDSDDTPAKAKRIAMCHNNPLQTALYAIGMKNEVMFVDFTNTSPRFAKFELIGHRTAIDFSVIEDEAGLLNVFAVGDDGLLYQSQQKTGVGDAIQFGEWVRLNRDNQGDVQFASVKPVIDENGVIELFLIGKDDGYLYQTRQLQPGANTQAGWSLLFPIGTSQANSIFAAARNQDGYAEAYTVTHNNELYRFWQNPLTTQWYTAHIQLKQSAEMVSVPSHSAELSVRDEDGVPQQNTPVKIKASTLATLRINGLYYIVNDVQPITVKTNASGGLVIERATNSLSSPSLQIQTEFMKPKESVTVESNAALQDKMHGTTKDDVWNAKGVDGNFLLQGDNRTEQNAESIAKIMQKSMSLGMSAPGQQPALKFLSANLRTTGLRHIPVESVGSPYRIVPHEVEEQHWEVSFSSGAPAFRELNRDEAQNSLVLARADGAIDGSFLGIDWGDIWKAIKDGVGKIIDGIEKFVVTTIIDPITKLVSSIKVVFTLFVDGVKYLLDKTIEFFQQAFDIVEGIWNSLKVFFNDLFHWLGFLFDWGDIQRTAEAIKHSMNETFDFAVIGIEALRGSVEKGFETFKCEIESGVDAFIKSLDPKQSIGQYAQQDAKPNPKFQESIGHNVLLNGFVDHYDQAQTENKALAVADTSVLDTLIQKLTELSQNFQFGDGKKAFEQAMHYFEQIGEHPSNALNLAMEGLVKLAEAIALVMIDVAEGIFLSILDLTVDIIQLTKAMLNDIWTIPFVSQLYKLITGDDLGFKPIDLLTLIMAVPGTIFYKVAFDKAPFPDQASLDVFKQRFTAQWMADQAGILPPAPQPATMALAEAETTFWDFVKALFDVIGAGTLIVRAPLETVQITLTSVGDTPPLVLNTAVVTCRFVNTVLAIPAFRPHKAPGLVWTTWGLQILCGPLLRGYGFVLAQWAAKFDVPKGVPDIFLSMWGCIHLVLAVVRVMIDPGRGTADAVDIMSTTSPQTLRFLTQPDIPYQPLWGIGLCIVTDLTYLAMALILVIGVVTHT